MKLAMYDLAPTPLDNALVALWNKTAIRGTASQLRPNVIVGDSASVAVDMALDGQTYHWAVNEQAVIDRKAQLDQIALRLRNISPAPLLVTEYMSKELAAHCRALGIQFIDTHGNAHLRRPGLLVFTSGEKNAHRLQMSKASKGLTSAAALRVIFTLLSKPQLVSATFKDVAALSGVATGSAYNVIGDLEQRGYLVAVRKRTRRVLEPSRLVDEWVINFPTALRAKLNCRRFSCPDPHWWKSAEITDFNAVWGSEVAAARMFKNLIPSTQTLYVEAQNMHDALTALAKKIRMRPDPHGEIEVLEKFWSPDIETMPGIAPPLLVYSDLLSLLDPRTKEAASQIRSNLIDPSFA